MRDNKDIPKKTFDIIFKTAKDSLKYCIQQNLFKEMKECT